MRQAKKSAEKKDSKQKAKAAPSQPFKVKSSASQNVAANSEGQEIEAIPKPRKRVQNRVSFCYDCVIQAE